MIRHQSIPAVMLFLGLCMTPASAQQDTAGSKDHPLITRYPGSVITNYVTHEFDEFLFPIGAAKYPAPPKTQRLEGKVTRIAYSHPANRSSLEIYRNYESALKKAGVHSVFTCAGDACGLARFQMTSDWSDLWNGPGEYYYSGKLSRPEGDAWVSLHVARGYTALDIIETKPMESGKVTVNAAALAGDITNAGHVAIYGIYFDTGNAEVKPESAPTLQEIGKLIQQNPNLKLYVVGHTDSVGDLAMNMDLSRRRADAVVKALSSTYGVSPGRLQAHGNGPLAPVASNKSEDGRAKNRRVELVER